MTTHRTAAEIGTALLKAYEEDGLWEEKRPYWALPVGLTRGSDPHLAYLTLVFAISGGRDPIALWSAAQQAFVADPELFDPHFLAYVPPARIRLKGHGLTQKSRSEAITWQRIGQALVMRAQGSVRTLLQTYGFNGRRLLTMLTQNKATFPVLSGSQTAPRWLYGLATAGLQPIKDIATVPTPLSASMKQTLLALKIEADNISAQSFEPLNALSRRGCRQRRPAQMVCPAVKGCPVAQFCIYSGELENQA